MDEFILIFEKNAMKKYSLLYIWIWTKYLYYRSEDKIWLDFHDKTCLKKI